MLMTIELSPFLQLAFVLAILLVVAKLAAYLSVLAHQPAVLGEILVGLLLGPTLLNFLHLPFLEGEALSITLGELSELGVLLLMFVAGLELHLADLLRNSKVSALSGTLGVLLPVAFGWGVGRLFGFGNQESLFLGLTLGATSVSISAQTLMELKVLRSRVGLGLLGAAVFDDVLVILLLSAFLAFASGDGGIGVVFIILGRMIAFLGLSAAFGMWALPFLVRRTARLPISQGVLTLGIVIMLVYSIAAELLGGMAAITGAFLAGLMFARSPEKERLERGINALAYGFFVPLFFVNIGLDVNLRALDATAIWLLIGLVLVAVLTKLAGAGLGARLAGFSWREAAQLGAGMVSRGEVGLILATVGMNNGLMSEAVFSNIIGVVLISTLLTPPLLRWLFKPVEAPTVIPAAASAMPAAPTVVTSEKQEGRLKSEEEVS